ncbi:MAG: hypothetical protein WA058_03980 [Minisyncoccia bacterium]
MEEEIIVEKVGTYDTGCNKWKWRRMKCGGSSTGAVYGLGVIGAALYYTNHADTFWIGVVGVLKAIVWPAFLVYRLLGYLGM